ncbi:MAG: MBL fold metallo-hydrolase [Gemmatimonadaceae bacterium]
MPTYSQRDQQGRFINPWPGAEAHGLRDALKWQRERSAVPEPELPPGTLPFPLAMPSFDAPRAAIDALSVTWVGHSTFLIQAGGINILTDPMWSERASPVQFTGPKRFMPPGIALDALPPIDLVLLSHNHYDHLDDATVRSIARGHAGARWVTPLGLAAWVRARGARDVTELDWWQETLAGDATVTGVPAQHFSARTPWDRGKTLWCGYAVRVGERRLYVAGDTAFFPEFRAIGERYGPFDIACIPIGAYDPRWFMRSVHMDAEEAVRAYIELCAPHSGARTAMVPMHWGTFKLTDEPLAEPPQRAVAAWRAAGLREELFWRLDHGGTAR